MGSFMSKASRATSVASRTYPTCVSPQQQSASKTAVQTKASPPPRSQQASPTKTEAIDLDGCDPTFAASLRSLGAVEVSPHSNPDIPQTSTPPTNNPSCHSHPDPRTNASVVLLQARQRIEEQAEHEAARAGKREFPGRVLIDAQTVRQVLRLRDEGVESGEIERRLGLKKGLVGRLGGRGVVGRV